MKAQRQRFRNTRLQWDGMCHIPIIFKRRKGKLAEFYYGTKNPYPAVNP